MGKPNNISGRNKQYVSGEIKWGYFKAVFEIPLIKLKIIERLMQNKFHDLNIRYYAETEFYNKKIKIKNN